MKEAGSCKIRILYGSDLTNDSKYVNAIVGEFVARLCEGIERAEQFGKYFSIGFADDKGLIAGIVFNRYSGWDARVHIATLSSRWASKRSFAAIGDFAFNKLGCVRLTAITSRKNKKARKLNEGAGFKLEGVQRKAFDGNQDMILYGMLKNECRWIK